MSFAIGANRLSISVNGGVDPCLSVGVPQDKQIAWELPHLGFPIKMMVGVCFLMAKSDPYSPHQQAASEVLFKD